MNTNGTPLEQRLARLITAARALANLGSIDHDEFIAPANLGRELREALAAYDQAHEDEE